jgi:hypothetical protein
MHPDIEFADVPCDLLEKKLVSESNRKALMEFGVPGFVAPHLFFGEFCDGEFLPSLSEWSWANDWEGNIDIARKKFDQFYVFGSGQNSEPIVVQHNKSPIYQIDVKGLHHTLLNSSIMQLYTCLDVIATIVDDVLLQEKDKAFEDVVTAEILKSIRYKIESIDSDAMQKNSVWDTLLGNYKISNNDV